MAMTYGGLIPNIGFNVHGIGQFIDSVYPNDSRIGIPRLVVSRAVLAAKTPAQAIRSTLVQQRAAGYNHLIAHESGELYSVEVSARRFSLVYGEDGYLVHTNHYLSPNMQAIEEANRAEYGLTAGLFSGEQAEVEKFFDEIEVGVTYVNKRSGATTGAWPGAQPFTGWKGSGSSGKGGCGPYYVMQFMREQSRCVIEEK